MSEPEKVIGDFIEAICALSKANTLTGIWDNRRFQECKKPFEQVDCQYVYKTEKLSRSNVELRAVCRTKIDVLFEGMLALMK